MSLRRNIRACVFDVDGVLIQPWRFASVLEHEYGLTSAITDGFFSGPFARCLLGQEDLMDALPSFLERWRWASSLQTFVDRWFAEDSVLNRELLSFVATMRSVGVPCYVASTQEKYRAEHLETILRFNELFDGCYFSCRLGYCKPDKRFFDLVASGIDCHGDEILFFDDKWQNVTAARMSGWNAELYAWGGMNPFVHTLQQGKSCEGEFEIEGRGRIVENGDRINDFD